MQSESISEIINLNNIKSDKSKEGVGSQSINATNSTTTTKNTTTTSHTANLPTARFEAMLNMIMTNGSAITNMQSIV
jgi:hypothetical protein